MTTENDYDEAARNYFAAQVAEIEAPVPEATITRAAADDAWAELLPLLTDEEVARAQEDEGYAAQLEATYAKWKAKRVVPSPARAVVSAPRDTVSPSVLAFETGAVAWTALSRADRETVLDRHMGPPPTEAIARFERGEIGAYDMTRNEHVEALARELDRRTARAKADRGERP